MRLSRSGLLALALLLGACATRAPLPDGGFDWVQREARLAAERLWQARGRIAYRSGPDGGQGSLTWTQSGSTARISLRGPFGAGAYRIEWDDQRIVVNSKLGERVAEYTGRDAADRFLEDQLGWTFPAGSIRYWLLGIADPEFPGRRRFDEHGRLAGIEQNGWDVGYDRFVESHGYLMPGRITVESERARVKLVVDEWSVGLETGA